ncbi:uncharacterized protein BCN122_II3222 [Burkholderia cenocepacia]|nr:uncharacterized protein BCN122_II3222 [Burkholderia cenocepacia]
MAGRQRQLLGCGDGGNDSAGGAGLTRGGITEAVGSGREGWRVPMESVSGGRLICSFCA